MSYWVALIARNAESHIEDTLNSIYAQTVLPKKIIAVDDGSTDGTGMILAKYASDRGLLHVITLPDRGYDIRRVPANINLASKSVGSVLTDFFMISGDDCSYPSNYAQSIIRRMIVSPETVVASGWPTSGSITAQEHVPSGSGRVIRCSYWAEIGGSYPVMAGWETWLLYKAEEKGFRVRLFDDLIFHHVRPRGAQHQFVYWGAAMRTLGYHPLYAVGRIAKNAVRRSIAVKGSLNMLRGYLQAGLGSADAFIAYFEPSLRRYVRSAQVRRMVGIARAVVGRYLL